MADKIKIRRFWNNCPGCKKTGTMQTVETQPDQGPSITVVECRSCGWREEV